MTKTKAKAPRSSKQAKQKLVKLMNVMEKATVPGATTAMNLTCRRIYCSPY
ncbi:hypothetical protein [Myxococcus sp. AB056]|uniref:hypothetical protein n=1 Tax=Myxococcus sp. AB056 TaxID=2562792 RepID=UPI001891D4FC|nr:hypothetical protein [Myxococcus sp. AB056]